MISAIETKILDTNSEYFGVSTTTLMENAGKSISEFIINSVNIKTKKILIFCGVGNNGGDGFVAARYLLKNFSISVFLTDTNLKTSNAKKNFNKLQELKIPLYNQIKDIDRLLDEHTIIVDAMLGIGISGELREPFSTLVKKINSAQNKIKISVDMPTGFGTNLSIKPHSTITFHDIKEGMNAENCGKITIVDIGIPSDAVRFVGPGELIHLYPRSHKQSHKGQNGKVLIIGGGPYTGAPALSAMAALRTGADLVYIATPKRCWKVIASYSPNFIVKELCSDYLTPEDIPVINDIIQQSDSVLIGPGLGRTKETEDAIIQIVESIIKTKKTLVIDADAIHAVGKHLERIKKSPIVYTPHRGEFKSLTGIDLEESLEEKINSICHWAQQYNSHIFLKGPIDIITNGTEVKLNKIHNEAMTVGGTGDVLAGIIVALLSKGINPFNAMRIGAFLNGEAGNVAFCKKSYGLLSTDIIETIPYVLQNYL
ncbi:MAG: NAD(P)H-hydrate dehydratase [Thermoplasmatota archaeon]